ncbi:hypothetical protein C1891_25255 [Pseudomonas sp. GW456-12-1-14-TSB6]|nr:hypothetical protein C1891_25255 [Pseudomonas sp. GW456-12-1-14-TSB6]
MGKISAEEPPGVATDRFSKTGGCIAAVWAMRGKWRVLYRRRVCTQWDTDTVAIHNPEIHTARSRRRQQRLDSISTQSRGTQDSSVALPVSTTTARW